MTVDDLPLLLAQLEWMGVQLLLDQHIPTHGNWVGLSLNWVTVLWLTHILSEADHRLNHVDPGLSSICIPYAAVPGSEATHSTSATTGWRRFWRPCTMTNVGRPLKAPGPSDCCACTT